MKLLHLFFFLFISITAGAQTDPATQLSNKIAQKMSDSLSLTSQQQNSIKSINVSLQQQKTLARQQHPDSLRYYLQRIENTRDTTYSTILTQGQYLLYKQKKKYLINNN